MLNVKTISVLSKLAVKYNTSTDTRRIIINNIHMYMTSVLTFHCTQNSANKPALASTKLQDSCAFTRIPIKLYNFACNS